MTIVVLLQTTSFLLIAFAQSQFQAILGVVCTSLALGLGEVTLLSTSAEYNKYVSIRLFYGLMVRTNFIKNSVLIIIIDWQACD